MKFHKIFTVVLTILLCFPFVLALNDGGWSPYVRAQTGDEVKDHPILHNGVYTLRDSFKDKAPEREWEPSSPTTRSAIDLYTTYVFISQPKTFDIGLRMCMGGNHPSGKEGVYVNGGKVYGHGVAGVPRDQIPIELVKGVNKIQVYHVEDHHTDDECHGNPFYLRGSKRVSRNVELMDSRGVFCNSDDQCCENGRFSVENSPCDEGSGYCDGEGTCINLDKDPDECRANFGENAYFDNGENTCCGDDDSDCLAYNGNKVCFPGNGWRNKAVGEIYNHPCYEGISVVLAPNRPYQCITEEPPLNYRFYLKASYLNAGDNMWLTESPQRGIEVEDSEYMEELSYTTGTRTVINTNIYMSEPKTIKFNLTCDSGPLKLVQLNDQEAYRKQTTNDPDSIELDLAAGWSQVKITCDNNNDYGDEEDADIYESLDGSVHIIIEPKLSSLVDVMDSVGDMPVKENTIVKEYTLMDMQEELDIIGSVIEFATAQQDIGAEFDMAAKGGEYEDEEYFEDEEIDDVEADISKITISAVSLDNKPDPNIVVTFDLEDDSADTTYNSDQFVYAKYVGDPIDLNEFKVLSITKDELTHDYICSFPVGSEEKNIAECFGTGAPFSSGTVGFQSMIGDAFNISRKNAYSGYYYCTENATWAHDLDSFQQACIRMKDPLGWAALTGKNLLQLGWTGSSCCSEQEDLFSNETVLGETYNDPDPENATSALETGACFNSTKIGNGVRPFEGVIVHKGQFLGCDLQTSAALEIADQITGNNLIEDRDVCTVLENVSYVSGNNFYCSLTGDWKYTPQSGERVTKQKLPDSTYDDSTEDCCLTDECFDGKNCIANQAQESSFTMHFGHRCIEGEWKVQTPKYTWNFAKAGFCPDDDQCLVNPEGNSENNNDPETYYHGPHDMPSCIQDGQSILQYYCSPDGWTTRTKYVGLQLLDFAEMNYPGDYELFCDTYDNVLNFVGYQAIQGANAVKNYIDACQSFGGRCVNQFCVLKFDDDKIAFGTSLNLPVNDISKSFLRALGQPISLCNNTINLDGDFDQCGQSNIWYNYDTNSLIHIPDEEIAPATPAQLEESTSFVLQMPMMELSEFVVDNEAAVGLPATFMDRTHLFEKLYVANRADRDYFGFVETDQSHLDLPTPVPVSYIGINYKNFALASQQDPCVFIRQIDPSFTGICAYDPDTRDLMMVRASLANTANPTLKAWGDLTAKLRFKEQQ